MHGLGNDFVIIDGRGHPPKLSSGQLRAIGDRHRGVGYDQLIVLENSATADVFMRIFNSDGTEAEACGNATRCVAHLMMTEKQKDIVVVETVAGHLKGKKISGGNIVVDMGVPNLDWQAIPLATKQDTDKVEISAGPLSYPVAVNMGNPHLVFFVENADEIELEKWGPVLENDSLLPAKANISVASPMENGEFRLRVWERGVGITLACGSAACATIVAACRRGLSDGKARLHLNGGPLDMEYLESGNVLMGGPVAYSFEGVLDLSLLEGSH
ncbi:diaminopimelate epimerase [Sneathiella glossodoripedis]|uniref:diaminopimelate epimerase n=1 Tax=Sneathiella glossodoripedis TaxID=418853 RepID=UPI0018FF254D|nr:diaminopimelate epimerase [Sneathiella glossodoripedis]